MSEENKTNEETKETTEAKSEEKSVDKDALRKELRAEILKEIEAEKNKGDEPELTPEQKKQRDMIKRAETVLVNQFQSELDEAPEYLQDTFKDRDDDLMTRLDDLRAEKEKFSKIRELVIKEQEEAQEQAKKEQGRLLNTGYHPVNFGEGVKIQPKTQPAPKQTERQKKQMSAAERRMSSWNGGIFEQQNK